VNSAKEIISLERIIMTPKDSLEQGERGSKCGFMTLAKEYWAPPLQLNTKHF